MENRTDPIITQEYIDNSMDIMFPNQTLPLSLKEKLFHWSREMEQSITIKNVIDVYSFAHIVALLQIYKDIEENKEVIQQENKYRPKRKQKSVEWIFKYMADQIKLTTRHTKKMYVGALRLKALYEIGISFDILIRSGCTPTDFFVTKDEYKEFLAQLPELEKVDNNFPPISTDVFFKKFIDNLNNHLLTENDSS